MNNNISLRQSGQGFNGSGEQFNYSIDSGYRTATPTQESWQSRVLAELKRSGIADDVIALNCKFVDAVEFDPITKEVISSPIADALNFKYAPEHRSEGGKAKVNSHAVLFVQETGETWQAKIFAPTSCLIEGAKDAGLISKPTRSGQYLAPKGIGDVLYLPHIPKRIVDAIANKYGIEPPNDGELVWDWVKRHHQIPIIITEGAKKALAAISQGQLAIALFGCQCGYDAYLKRLKPELLPFAKGREVIIALDKDANPKTIRKVRTAQSKLARGIKRAKGRALILDWDSQDGKGLDDLIAGNPELFHKALDTAQTFQKWKLEKEKNLDGLVSLRINSRYFSDAIKDIPQNEKLVAVIGCQGTGKTQLFETVSATNQSQGTKTLPITHREQLSRQIGARLNLDYRTELTKDNGIFGYSLCIDSLHPKANPPFNPEDWDGATVILDEFDQELWHILNSNTCKSNRTQILQSLKELVNVAGQIIIASADLDRRHIEFIQSLFDEPVKPYVIVNDWQPENKRPLYVYDKPEELYSELKKHLANGENILIHTGGQKDSSKWGTKGLESLIAKDFPHLQLIRIDRETTSNPNHSAYGCIANLNQFLPRYNVAICSPVLETGASVEIAHYDAVFCFASGSQTVFGVSQTVERLRKDVPRYLYAPDQALFNRIGNGSDDPYLLKSYIIDMAKSGVKLSGKDGEIWDTYNGLDKLDKESKEYGDVTKYVDTWASLAAEINYGFKDYRAEILALLGNRYEVMPTPFLDENDVDKSKEDAKINRDGNLESYCQAVANAEILSEIDYKLISNKRAKTETERLNEKKTELSRRYATPDIIPNLVEFDDKPNFYSGLRLEYFCTVGNEFLPQRDSRALDSLAENGLPFIVDVGRATLGVRVSLLQYLNLPALIEQGKIFDNETPELIDLLNKTRQNSMAIRSALGVWVSDDPNAKDSTPINLFRRYLALFGLKLKRISKGNGAITIASYQVIPACQYNRPAQFNRWLENDRNFAEAITPQELGGFGDDFVSTESSKQVGYKYIENNPTEDLLTTKVVQSIDSKDLLTTKAVQNLESDDGLEFIAKTKEDAPMTEQETIPIFPIGSRIRRKTDGAELIVLDQVNGTIHHCPVNGGDVGMTAIDWVEAA